MIKTIFGILLIFSGVLDSAKYIIQADKIKQRRSAKNISRQFVNIAIFCDILRLLYGIIINDFYIISISVLTLICMCYLWWQVYVFYIYKSYPKKVIIYRPGLFLYFWNSILPNKIRERL